MDTVSAAALMRAETDKRGVKVEVLRAKDSTAVVCTRHHASLHTHEHTHGIQNTHINIHCAPSILATSLMKMRL